ncbi:MAG: hypothetical protein M1816_003017 [Peltula sp. TS41687]|nr:MAG: hypothetical protein M1816_003017 [Peltula sp. TS41687]
MSSYQNFHRSALFLRFLTTLTCLLLAKGISASRLPVRDLSPNRYSSYGSNLSPFPWARPNQAQSAAKCRCYPGDKCWPNPQTWAEFNKTIGGKLIATVPLASPCHDDNFTAYNAEQCTNLQSQWLQPQIHYESSSSIMAPFFANRSCDPFLPRSAQCIVGAYVSYAVDVKEPSDIAKTIWFATYHNIRLVVRNTGHDYNGKSSGPGALAIWTHHLKSIQFQDYASPKYTGKAIKVGSGVQIMEAYEAANANGLAVVGAECPTVGYAGGYTQGGGHSALSSKYGLAADQVLEWEVVDGTGRLLRATPTEHSDLYWALSGGGGGTYGVVTSMTSKAHKDIPVTGANLTFTNANISQDQFYEAVSVYHASLPAIVDAGAVTQSFLTNSSFAIAPLTAPGLSETQVRELMSPLTAKLTQLGVKYTQTILQFAGYLAEYTAMQNPIPVGIGQYGGRFIPRSVVEKNNSALTAAYRYITENGGQVVGIGVNVSKAVSGDVSNSVNPIWRDTLIDTVVATPWSYTAPLEEMVANQLAMTNLFIPRLAGLTPNGGAYLNEGDFRQPDFQRVFYGDNYARLNSIKNQYDPNHMLYALTAVGSEFWVPRNDGRLCRA